MLTPFLATFGVLGVIYIAQLDKFRLDRIFRLLVCQYGLFLMLEMLWRFLEEPGCFLNYGCRFEAKVAGLFSTTNALATSLVCFLLPVIVTNGALARVKFFFSFILVSTMARAAIVAFSSSLFAWKFIASRSKIYYYLMFISIFPIFLLSFSNYFLQDGSFMSKLEFFSAGFDIFLRSSANGRMFGLGSSYETIVDTLGVSGFSPHSPILKSFLYFGIVGLIFYIFSLVSFLTLDGRYGYVVLCVLVLGFAGAPIYLPSLIVPFLIFRRHQLKWREV